MLVCFTFKGLLLSGVFLVISMSDFEDYDAFGDQEFSSAAVGVASLASGVSSGVASGVASGVLLLGKRNATPG